jgi:hypothetical protein
MFSLPTSTAPAAFSHAPPDLSLRRALSARIIRPPCAKYRSCEQVLQRDRDAVQRAAVLASRDLIRRRLRGGPRPV